MRTFVIAYDQYVTQYSRYQRDREVGKPFTRFIHECIDEVTFRILVGNVLAAAHQTDNAARAGYIDHYCRRSGQYSSLLSRESIERGLYTRIKKLSISTKHGTTDQILRYKASVDRTVARLGSSPSEKELVKIAQTKLNPQRLREKVFALVQLGTAEQKKCRTSWKLYMALVHEQSLAMSPWIRPNETLSAPASTGGGGGAAKRSAAVKPAEDDPSDPEADGASGRDPSQPWRS